MNSITLFRERLRTRSVHYGICRFLNILKNYGLTPIPFADLLNHYVGFLSQHNIQPTFPVTALAVHRHPDLFKKLQNRGVEFAIHGYRHMDYTQLEPRIIRSHIEKAIQIFNNNGIRYHGFRFPFLKRNTESTQAVSEFNFNWESSEVIASPLPESIKTSQARHQDYQKLLQTYRVRPAGVISSLPWTFLGCLEIPVSVPDDDLLIERLNLSRSCIRSVWLSMLESTRLRNEMLIMQLHPERFFAFISILKAVIQKAKTMQDIWIAPLCDIATWWRERAQYEVDLRRDLNGWTIEPIAGSRMTFEVRVKSKKQHSWEWQRVDQHQVIDSERKPVIGLKTSMNHEMIDILNQEGYLLENAGDNHYGLLLDDSDLKTSEALSKKIDMAEYPLIRKKRWPYPFQSVLSITGDIDGIDLWDYWTRFYGK